MLDNQSAMRHHYDMPGTRILRLADVVNDMGNGWLYLYRPRGLRSWKSRVIADSTRGPYSHAGMVRRTCENINECQDRTLCNHPQCPRARYSFDVLEMIEHKGGRAVPLESIIDRSPGCIDIFEPDLKHFPEYNAAGAVEYMRDLTGMEYGWRAVARLVIRMIPFAWHFFRCTMEDPREWKYPPFCSFAVETACRKGGGVEAVNNLSADLVSPNDLFHSPFWRYVCTLR